MDKGTRKKRNPRAVITLEVGKSRDAVNMRIDFYPNAGALNGTGVMTLIEGFMLGIDKTKEEGTTKQRSGEG